MNCKCTNSTYIRPCDICGGDRISMPCSCARDSEAPVPASPDEEFRKWRDSLPASHWARYDLSACRLGWDAAAEFYQQNDDKDHNEPMRCSKCKCSKAKYFYDEKFKRCIICLRPWNIQPGQLTQNQVTIEDHRSPRTGGE